MSIDLAGLGSAIMDALIRIDDDSLLAELGLNRGQMQFVDHQRWHAIYDRLHHFGVDVYSGGSCANTVATAALCGANAHFCGQVGDDAFGGAYQESLASAGAVPQLRVRNGGISGKCLSLISRLDGERTMLTDLGIAAAMDGLGPFADIIRSARVVHFEGYLFLPGPAQAIAWEAVRVANAANVPVSVDCADPFVAHTIRDDFTRLLREHATIAFLNREEAETITGKGAYAAIDEVGGWVDWAVVKLGSEGSLVHRLGETHKVRVFPTTVRDTTGAGDAYAGGFLYGWLQGWDAARCGELGSRVASLTVGQMGAVCRDSAAMAAARHATESA